MLEVDRAAIAADGDDLAFITVKITDEKDRLVPRVDNTISYTIEGPGRIVAVDNGDPTSHESFQATTRKAFNGLALVVVRSNAGEKGKITVTARSEGLRGASIGVTSR
jgi:beta-galactosidase